MKILFALKLILMFKSDHNIAHVMTADMTCAKFWPDLIIILQANASQILMRFGLWAHKPLVEWIPGPRESTPVLVQA